VANKGSGDSDAATLATGDFAAGDDAPADQTTPVEAQA